MMNAMNTVEAEIDADRKMMARNNNVAALEEIAEKGRVRLAEMQAEIDGHRSEWLDDFRRFCRFVEVLEANYPSLADVHGMTRAAVEVLPLRVKWKVKDGWLNNWRDHSWLESVYGDVRVVLNPATPDVLSGPQLLTLQKKREEDKFTLAKHYLHSFMFPDSPLPEGNAQLEEWRKTGKVIAGAYRDLERDMKGEA